MSQQELFCSLLYDDRKQDSATTDEYSKPIIGMLQSITAFFSDTSNVWENTDGCAEQYHCATALYLLSMLSHEYNITIDFGVGSPGYSREIVDGLNDTKNVFL